jgi:hypothetical protein
MKKIFSVFRACWRDKSARLVLLTWLFTSVGILGSLALAGTGPFAPIVNVFCGFYTAFNTTGRFLIVFFGLISIGVGLWLNRGREMPRVAWTLVGLGVIVTAGTLATTLFGTGLTAACGGTT